MDNANDVHPALQAGLSHDEPSALDPGLSENGDVRARGRRVRHKPSHFSLQFRDIQVARYRSIGNKIFNPKQSSVTSETEIETVINLHGRFTGGNVSQRELGRDAGVIAAGNGREFQERRSLNPDGMMLVTLRRDND